MLSPDSFYYFFRENYGYPMFDNVLFYPKYNGAKLVDEFISYVHGDFKERYHRMDKKEKSQFGSIVLHDQEPLMDLWYFASTYLKKHFVDKSFTENEVAKLLYNKFSTKKIPIWCHSEKNSREIDFLKEAGWIDCYYWYHGLISLNWFNDWRWCNDLDRARKNPMAKKFMIYARDFTGTRQYRKDLIDQLYSLRHLILYDWQRSKIIDPSFSAKIDIDDARNSYIHIIAETIFDTGKQHLTEKTLKPIVMSQPFIMASGPGSLEYIRSYGFQTFNTVWNEDYDLETDSDRRLEMIVELINTLAALSDSQFQKMYEKTLPIIAHNRKWFYSEKFYDILIGELETNIETAIKKSNNQDRLLSMEPSQSLPGSDS